MLASIDAVDAMPDGVDVGGVARPIPMNFDFHRGGVDIAAGPHGDRIVALRRFDAQQPVFAGHFPSNKILPGVMLVEFALYLAQAYLQTRRDARRLIELSSASFLAPVTPGYRVQCSCDMQPAEDGDTVLMRASLTRLAAAQDAGDVLCARVRAVFGRR
jgi:3-hydroxymyristoyl/3-hydroxydecanoyl-(acyl carrier protein) dehydratase